MRNKALVSAGIVTVGLVGMVGTSMAASNSTADSSSLVAKISKQFNLNQQDVQKVFDQDKTEHQTERKARLEVKLAQAVTDGKITADQKTKILAKLDEIQTKHKANRDAMKVENETQRKTAMEAEHAALQKWATDNNIPAEYFRFEMGGHGGLGGLPSDENRNYGSTTRKYENN